MRRGPLSMHAVLVGGATVFALAGCARMLGAVPIGETSPTRTSFHEIRVGEGRRNFLLHRPAETDRAMPLLIALHGSSANANTVEQESGLDGIADSVGAMVVYPNGTGGIPFFRLFWNYQGCCGGGRAPDEGAMIRAIVDTLAGHFAIDRSRVGVIGFSDAGTLAYRLVCSGAPVTAIGIISGEVPTDCVPHRAVPTIVFHGTADRNIPYRDTDRLVADWARREGCTTARTDSLASVARATYEKCNDDAAVVLYTILGGRHAWPGGRRSWPFAPAPTRAVDASRVFTAFVLAHPGRLP